MADSGARRRGCGKRWQMIKVEIQFFKKKKKREVIPGEGWSAFGEMTALGIYNVPGLCFSPQAVTCPQIKDKFKGRPILPKAPRLR